jgi:hypothetical protein
MPQMHRLFADPLKPTNAAACSDPPKTYSTESYLNKRNNHFKS